VSRIRDFLARAAAAEEAVFGSEKRDESPSDFLTYENGGVAAGAVHRCGVGYKAYFTAQNRGRSEKPVDACAHFGGIIKRSA
jgi:hypothetical protein